MALLRRKIISILILLLLTSGLKAQQTEIYKEPAQSYLSGKDLFEKEKYGAAQKQFEFVIQSIENPESPLRVNAEYYEALCALELYNSDAEYKLASFARNHPSSSYQNLVNFQLGKLAHGDRKYRNALEYFEKVDVTELSKEEQAEYYFKSGYCYFRRDEFDKARQTFTKVQNANSKYSSPAAYYLAHLSYVEGNYDQALEEFLELENDPNFKAIAPYYIVQIYFLKEQYSKVISMAPPLLINATDKRASELTRVLGQSYFYLGEYEKARPYLEQYFMSSRYQMNPSDYYILGRTFYETGDYEEAARNLQRATGQNDTLAQYAYYYLGAAYLKTDQKQFAANAFNSSYKIPFDAEIREDALFKQAQLAFELSYDPYSEAVRSLRAYLKAYPESKRADEAYNFLFKISMATRNFKDAREALENIQVKGADYKGNFQKITFYHAIELFNQYNYEEAVKMFTKATEFDEDKEITAESIFWIAESFYRQENYWGAKKYYLDFLAAPKAKKLVVYNIANYSLGYVYFKRKEYKGSIYYFKEFVSKSKDEEPVMVADACLRLGDAWFTNKGYDEAISYYDKAISYNAIDVDYALIQKSKALGVLQRYPEQVMALQKVINRYPNSSYISEAYYELANAYLVTKDNEKALINYKKVASDFPSSNYAVKSRLKAGLIYYNSGLNDLALSTFKGVITDYPATTESREALESIRNIYVDMGRVDDFFDYAKNLSFANISASEQDSITYTSAENQYMNGDAGAKNALQAYLDKFPKGAFTISASYYLADEEVKAGNKEAALGLYEYVLENKGSEFTESALLKAADLSFELENYAKSAEYFGKLKQIAQNKESILESWYGLMKSNYLLENYAEAIQPADLLLAEPKISDEMKQEAMVIRANSLFKTDEILLAKGQFKAIAEYSQGEAGAEAQYRIAEIEYDLKDLDNAEKSVFTLINNYAPYDYWVASGFILLADIYVAKGNTFQAKQTLQSIIDNYEGIELKNIALAKLNAILDAEEAEQSGATQDEGAESINIDGENVQLEKF
ncbi:MAG TPA: tetratricopeptide repeat protein [Bacteroidales bacterium]|nr:tetratricopeptide repeat protein [Bacteroidales bacterium]